MFSILSKILKINHRATYLKYLSIIYNIRIDKLAEIGVYQGKNSKILKLLFPKADIFLIDPWDLNEDYEDYLKKGYPPSKKKEDFKKAYEEVLKKFANDPKVHILKMTSKEAKEKVPELDLVFIDGNHEYRFVKQDIKIWNKKIKKGIISGHDYNKNVFPDVVKAVDEIFGEKIILGQDSVWAHIK